jgi:hypothetical protein
MLFHAMDPASTPRRYFLGENRLSAPSCEQAAHGPSCMSDARRQRCPEHFGIEAPLA